MVVERIGRGGGRRRWWRTLISEREKITLSGKGLLKLYKKHTIQTCTEFDKSYFLGNLTELMEMEEETQFLLGP